MAMEGPTSIKSTDLVHEAYSLYESWNISSKSLNEPSVSKIDIRFGAVREKFRPGVNVVSLSSWQIYQRKLQEEKMAKKDSKIIPRSSAWGSGRHDYEDDDDYDDDFDDDKEHTMPYTSRSEGLISVYVRNREQKTENIQDSEKLQAAKILGSKKLNIKSKMDNSWKSSRESYSMRYNMSFNNPSNSTMLSYEAAARTSRPKMAAVSQPSQVENSPETEKSTKYLNRFSAPSQLITSQLNKPVLCVSPRPRLSKSALDITKDQETRSGGKVAPQVCNQLPVSDGRIARDPFCGKKRYSTRETSITDLSISAVTKQDASVSVGKTSMINIPTQQKFSIPVHHHRKDNVQDASKIQMEDGYDSLSSNTKGAAPQAVSSEHRLDVDCAGDTLALPLDKLTENLRKSRLSVTVIDGTTLEQDTTTTRTVQSRPCNMYRSGNAPSRTPRSTTTQPKWSSSLWSRNRKTSPVPRPVNFLLTCVPSDTGLEVVSESIICVENGQYQAIEVKDCSIHGNFRSHGNVKSQLHGRSKSVPLPLLDLLEATCGNATMRSNYKRRKFIMGTSSMNLTKRAVEIAPRPMSDFAVAQLEKKKAQEKTEKTESATRTKSPVKSSHNMIDEIKGLMKKAHKQSNEAEKKIVNVTVPNSS